MESQTTTSTPTGLKGLAQGYSKRQKILAGVGTLATLLAVYSLYQHFTYVTTDNAQVQGNTVMLAAKVTGYVTKVHVKENQKVKAGDVLAELEPRDFQNALQQAESEWGAIQARAKDAERNYARIAELFKKSAVSRQQFDSADAAYRDTKSRLAAVQAQVDQARLNLEYTRIKAPQDGMIAKKGVDIGMLAAAGTPLVGFVSSNERWVIANFKETELADIHVGHAASIEVDAIPGRTFSGKVDSISSATGSTFTLLPPDNATGNFTKVVQRVPVKITFEQLTDQDLDLLRAGLSSFVKVHKR